MRTLKKTLCLVLALVLCLGLVGTAFASNIDKYTDAKTVGAAYTEAVDVMIGTGIISGMTATEIGATGTLTREQAAKIITYMAVGPKMAETLKADKAPFSDVAADRWSAGYIAYCVKAEIVSGIGGGKFDPTGELTGFQFAKMLLAAVGVKGNYTGEGWTIAVAQNGFNAGLFAGDETAASNNALQRQQAMLMAFNGLNFSKSAATSVYVVTKGANVLYSGTDALTALVMKQGNEGSELSQKVVSTGSLGSINYGLTKTSKTDEFGRTSTAWTNGQPAGSKAEKVYSKLASAAVKTYTTATTYGKIVSDLGFTKVADKVNFTVIEDGVKGASAQYDKTSKVAIGGQGVLVEVYKTAANTYDIVVVNTYVVTLAKGDVVAAKKATATTDAEAAYIKIGTKTYETDAFKAGDVVLYTVADGEIASVEKAASVAGKVTATAAGYFKVDGEKMVLAACNDATIGSTAGYMIDAANEYTYFLDNYGNVVLAKAGVVVPVAKNYIYVIEAAAKAGTSSAETLLDAAVSKPAAAKARVLDLTTGEIKVVDIAVVNGTGANAGKYFYADAQGKAAEEVKTESFKPEAIYEYTTLADGSYVFGAAAAGESVTLTKGSAAGVAGKVMTSSTVVNVVEYTKSATGAYTGATVTTTTGIANFPAVPATYTGAIVAANPLTGVVTSITVVKAKSAPVATTKYAIYNGVGETDAQGTKYGFYVDGELVEFYATTALSLTKGDVVSYTLTNGKISAAEKKAPIASAQAVTYVDTTFVVAGGNVYYFAKTGCSAFDAITKAAVELTAGTAVTLYGKDANNVDFVVVSALAD